MSVENFESLPPFFNRIASLISCIVNNWLPPRQLLTYWRIPSLDSLGQHFCIKVGLNSYKLPILGVYRQCPKMPRNWWNTYVPSLISSILTSQAFRIQICGAIEQLSPMVLWDMLYLKMSRFLSLVYKQEIFDYFMWMSPWRSGSMQVSHAEGPWFQSRSSSFFFFCNIFLLHKSLVFSFKFM